MAFQFSNIGSRYREIREPVLEDGRRVVKVVGKEDLQDYINSFADACDVELLVRKAVNGDDTALNQRQGMYGDFSDFPKTYAEVLQRVIDAENLFQKLPPDVRARFENSTYKFISEMDEPDWALRAGLAAESAADPDEKVEVKE